MGVQRGFEIRLVTIDYENKEQHELSDIFQQESTHALTSTQCRVNKHQ